MSIRPVRTGREGARRKAGSAAAWGDLPFIALGFFRQCTWCEGAMAFAGGTVGWSMEIIFEFVGGPFDGKTVVGTEGRQDEADR